MDSEKKSVVLGCGQNDWRLKQLPFFHLHIQFSTNPFSLELCFFVVTAAQQMLLLFYLTRTALGFHAEIYVRFLENSLYGSFL